MKDEQTWTKLTKEIAALKEELNKIKGELTCPFCGGKVEIVALDLFGKEYTEEEEKNLKPEKQLKYVLKHEEPEELSQCPIATVKGESLGVYFYMSRKEAYNVWNRRMI